MRGKFKFTITIFVVFTIGCRAVQKNQISVDQTSLPILAENVNESLTPKSANISVELSEQHFDAGPLNEFNFNDPDNFLRVTLDQCIENALRNSNVVRELGGTALRAPELMITANDPAIAYTDPVIGEEAALSEFDANFANEFAFQNNDRAFNSSFIGDQGQLSQKLATNTTRLSKRSATGTLFQINNQILYDFNNTPANRFANNVAYDTYLETEFRQPLLQGGGVLFNRIAGPNNRPGVNTGVLIARTNTDITLAEFELGIRNLISEVENAYWDLYFAYRDLESRVEARNGAYKIWESLRAQGQDKKTSEILQAEEQYYLFASRVKDAIHGQLNDGTRTFNGSSSGTFRGNSGVRTAERRLRLIAGYPLNESMLIVPQDMPIEAQVVFDWEQVRTDALSKRTELRRQRWVLKREELNLIANKNFLLPRVDVFGKYRVRGFGNDLFGNDGFQPLVTPAMNAQDGTDAYRTFLNGDLQEWELGMDVNIPIGYRRQWAAVRNSELAYTRQKKILLEQEREIVYGLSNSLGEVQRTSSLMEVNARRLDASKRQYTAIQEDFDNDDTTINLVLESQRRVIDAKLDYFRTQVEFMLAVKSVHFEKGTMLQYHNVALTESGWTRDDYREAMERENNKSRPLNYYCPGINISTPLDQPQIGYAGQEPEFLTRQKAKAKSDAMFADNDQREKEASDEILEDEPSTEQIASDVDGEDVGESVADASSIESANEPETSPDSGSKLLGLAEKLNAVESGSVSVDSDPTDLLSKIKSPMQLAAEATSKRISDPKPARTNDEVPTQPILNVENKTSPHSSPDVESKQARSTPMPPASTVIGNFGDTPRHQTPQPVQITPSARINRNVANTSNGATSASNTDQVLGESLPRQSEMPILPTVDSKKLIQPLAPTTGQPVRVSRLPDTVGQPTSSRR